MYYYYTAEHKYILTQNIISLNLGKICSISFMPYNIITRKCNMRVPQQIYYTLLRIYKRF